MPTTATETIVICPNCGAKNRVDMNRLSSQRPVCGRCKRELPLSSASGEPVIVNDDTFDAILRSAGARPVLVDCWAPWCGPCRMLSPVIEQIARESGGKFVIAKLNTDENPRISSQYRISAIPTLLIFRNGQLVEQLVGLQPKQAIIQKLLSVSG